MLDIDDLAAEAKAQREGLPLDLGRGRILWIAYAGDHNREFLLAKSRHALAVRDEFMAADADRRTELEDQVAAAVIADALIVRWYGFTEGGEPVEYTQKLGVELLERAPGLHERIMDLATDREGYSVTEDCKSASGRDPLGG